MSFLFGGNKTISRLETDQRNQLTMATAEANRARTALEAQRTATEASLRQSAATALNEQQASRRRRVTGLSPGVATSNLGILTQPYTGSTTLLGN